MFSLIITIISIALVAALAIATLYYGGSAFSQGTAKAKAATVVNHGQQITGANTLYANDFSGNYATTIAQLTAGSYLASEPKSGVSAASYVLGTTTTNVVTLASVPDEVCKKINVQANLGDTVTPTGTANAQFSCTSGAFTFKG